jgi:hypothetical protein
MSSKYVLQSVIVKKSKKIGSVAKAMRIAREYADRIYTTRETASSFRFRQRKVSDFDKFRSKKINNYITLVYGRLK